MEQHTDEGWRRLGQMIRQTRMNLGVNSRDALAETAQVSKRVIADLESGARDNFSERVLSKIEETLGWTSGTIDLIVTDPNFHPPEPQDSDDLMFVPAHYDRRPVAVESTAVTRLIAALKALGESNGDQLTPETRQLAEAAIGVCWPYIIRLVEDNCIPGVQLNPAVRPSYSAFTAVARYLAPADPSASYTQWLAGDLTGASESIAQRYRTRWVESTRVRRGRAPAPPQGAPQDS